MQSTRLFRLPRSALCRCNSSGPKWGESQARRAAQCGLSTSRTGNSETRASKVPLRIMPLGGSITYGVGSPDGNGYRKTLYDILVARGYTTEMVGSRRSGSMVNNHNEGWRGCRIDQIHEKAKAAARLLPNLFTVNAGSNDCLQGFQIPSAGARLDALIEELWTLAPGATVILSTLLVTSNKQANATIFRVNEQIRDLVERKSAQQKSILLAEMYSCVGAPQLRDLVEDGVHPNADGYAKMAIIWADSIDKAARSGILRRPGISADERSDDANSPGAHAER
ncbi:SGNH hydrolase-type esterase domain-containing protein [Aspergillus navahoensis]